MTPPAHAHLFTTMHERVSLKFVEFSCKQRRFLLLRKLSDSSMVEVCVKSAHDMYCTSGLGFN